MQVEKFELDLKQLEALLSRAWTGGVLDVNAMEKTISSAEEMVQSMQKNADTLRGNRVPPFCLQNAGSLPIFSNEGLFSCFCSDTPDHILI